MDAKTLWKNLRRKTTKQQLLFLKEYYEVHKERPLGMNLNLFLAAMIASLVTAKYYTLVSYGLIIMSIIMYSYATNKYYDKIKLFKQRWEVIEYDRRTKKSRRKS